MYVNGQEVSVPGGISLSEFLEKEGYNAQRVAVEKNGTIVLRKLFETERLSDSDKLEIVSFVGGG